MKEEMGKEDGSRQRRRTESRGTEGCDTTGRKRTQRVRTEKTQTTLYFPLTLSEGKRKSFRDSQFFKPWLWPCYRPAPTLYNMHLYCTIPN